MYNHKGVFYEKSKYLNTDGLSGDKALAGLIDALDSFLPVT